MKKIKGIPGILQIIETYNCHGRICMVTEKMDTDLLQYVKNHGKLTEKSAKKVFIALSNAIKVCHQIGIMHRDIKPDNILLNIDSNGGISDIKLCDFGLSCYLDKRSSSSDFCGTLSYISPEMLMFNSLYDERIDLWGLGQILHFILLGRKPFNGRSDREKINKLMNNKRRISSIELLHTSDQALELIDGLLQVNK